MSQETKQTPMMAQYFAIKKQYPDAFLFYRLGDFYELFHEDAIEAARILEITLTSRNKNAPDPIPMCGVPHHAASEYIRTLVEKGYKVAICEQMEDPKLTKGMVKRDVVQVLTPGTYVADSEQPTRMNNFLTAVTQREQGFALASVDIGTGELRVTTLQTIEEVITELQSYATKEIVYQSSNQHLADQLKERMGILLSEQDESSVEQIVPSSWEMEPETEEVLTLLLRYLQKTQKRNLTHIQAPVFYEADHYLKMDEYAKRNLELTASIRTQQKAGSLLWLLDRTKTAMGARKLKQWLEKPLVHTTSITDRLDKVGSFLEHYFERHDIVEALQSVYDLERLVAKVSFGNVNGRDLNQLKRSLEQIPLIQEALEAMNDERWRTVLDQLTTFPELVDLISSAITDQPPLLITEGNVIRDGYNEQLDEYRDAMANGKKWIAALQQQEREKTGIKTLKIGYNRVFGYYIEVTKANVPLLEEGRYDRKQTLANAERFITPELKEKERIILEAEEESAKLEHALFLTVREQVKEYRLALQNLAKVVAEIDVLQSFAHLSEEKDYQRPSLSSTSKEFIIKEGRHPIVEEVMGREKYIPNDLTMDETNEMILITGPNMSGKSTYMRQVALITIMAQMGCYVPASEAIIPICDQIFTRIGAADDLFSGQSTFMIEMVETNNALRNATERSLLLFDEIGRGTATYDGMALAEAILRFVHNNQKGKLLFSTHYHELTSLEETLPKLRNVHVGAIEQDGELVFLHKVMQGPADKSYGLHVAKLAGLPNSLLAEAKEILKQLESGKSNEVPTSMNESQLSLFEGPVLDLNQKQVIDEIMEFDLMNQTPLNVVNQLDKWKQMITKEKRV